MFTIILNADKTCWNFSEFFAVAEEKYIYEKSREKFSAWEIIKTKKSYGQPDFLSDEIF